MRQVLSTRGDARIERPHVGVLGRVPSLKKKLVKLEHELHSLRMLNTKDLSGRDSIVTNRVQPGGLSVRALVVVR